MRTVFHERAAHAWHRRVLIRLAATRTGRFKVVLLRADLIVQVRLQYAVLDHYRFAGFVAFVVIVQRTTLARNIGLINDRYERFGNLLANHVGVDAGTHAVKVCLHAVTNRLMKQNAARTCCQNYGHLTHWRTYCLKLDHGASDGLVDCL